MDEALVRRTMQALNAVLVAVRHLANERRITVRDVAWIADAVEPVPFWAMSERPDDVLPVLTATFRELADRYPEMGIAYHVFLGTERE